MADELAELPQELVVGLDVACAVEQHVRHRLTDGRILQEEPVGEHLEAVVHVSGIFCFRQDEVFASDGHPPEALKDQHSFQSAGLVEAFAASAKLVLGRVTWGVFFLKL